MKVKVSELIGPPLDWAVAKCIGNTFVSDYPHLLISGFRPSSFSTDWSQGGPVIEREKIDIIALRVGGFRSYHTPTHEAKTHTYAEGPTPLIAAMRCFVASKLGNKVDIPMVQ